MNAHRRLPRSWNAITSMLILLGLVLTPSGPSAEVRAQEAESPYVLAVFDQPRNRPQPYLEIRNPALLSELHSAPVVSPSAVGPASYTELDTLFVIYTNTAAGNLNSSDVTRVQSHASETAKFIWRQSHFKFFLRLTFLVINNFKDASEFNELYPGGYWLSPTDEDGDGVSVEKDLLARGVTANQYDSINYLWAHNNDTLPAAYGGLGGLIGWDLGFTGITQNPIFDASGSPRFDTAFPHEIQHTIDAMMEVSGYPGYFFPDRPWDYPGAFGENWSFWEYQMKHWPVNNWLVLQSPWGDALQFVDGDGDGVPDSGAALPITEQALGSSSSLVDSDSDAFSDLNEATAGLFVNSNLNNTDTDMDGRSDGVDAEPLYSIQTEIGNQTQTLDGDPAGWELLTGSIHQSNALFAPRVYANWDSSYLYLMVEVDMFAGIHVRIDANADGWFHGKDNYHLAMDPSYPNPADSLIMAEAHIWDSSAATIATTVFPMWDDDPAYPFPRLITKNSIARYARSYNDGFLIQIAIPANAATGLVPQNGERLGINITYNDIARQGELWAETFERDDFAYVTLGTPNIFADVPSSYWAWNFVERLYEAGITGGCGVNPLIYCPEGIVTRAQMAVFLERGIHGAGYNPPAVGNSTGFGDVSAGYWAAAWIKQLAADGITGGCGANLYCPEAPVTRAQMAVFLLRSKHGSGYSPPGVGAGTGFSDVPAAHWAAAWIKQLVAEGITSGCGTGTYCPEAPVTRAQMAVFLVRTFVLP